VPTIRSRSGQSLHSAGRVKFIVDAQLPPALASALRDAGYDVQAVREMGLRDAEDSEIWAYALEKNAGIITKDQDFADRSILAQGAPVIIVWLRIGNTSNQALLSWLLPLWPAILDRIESGDRLVEVREKP